MEKPIKPIALIGLLLVSGIANADSKAIAGSICAAVTSGGYLNTSPPLILPGGAITNENTGNASRITLQCPIVRDRTGNSPILTLEVRIKRNGPVGNLPFATCGVQSTDQWGNLFFTEAKQTPIRGSNPNRMLKFTNLPTKSKGAVTVRCVVPKGYQLSTIFWNE